MKKNKIAKSEISLSDLCFPSAQLRRWKLFVIVFSFLFASFSQAPVGLSDSRVSDSNRNIPDAANKTIEGEVTAKNKHGLAVLYNRDKARGIDYEMWIPYEHDALMVGTDDLESLSEGDRVAVNYDESQDGKRRMMKSVNRTAQSSEDDPEGVIL